KARSAGAGERFSPPIRWNPPITCPRRELMSVSPSAGPPSNGAAPAPRLNLSELDVAPELFSLVPRRLAELHELVPVFRQNGTLTVAMARPENLVAVDELARLTGLKIRPVRVTVEELQRAMVRFYAGE